MYGATENAEEGLQVIGAGYGRTGTDSLKVALNELGYKTYHMYECSLHGDHQKWIDADTQVGATVLLAYARVFAINNRGAQLLPYMSVD